MADKSGDLVEHSYLEVFGIVVYESLIGFRNYGELEVFITIFKYPPSLLKNYHSSSIALSHS